MVTLYRQSSTHTPSPLRLFNRIMTSFRNVSLQARFCVSSSCALRVQERTPENHTDTRAGPSNELASNGWVQKSEYLWVARADGIDKIPRTWTYRRPSCSGPRPLLSPSARLVFLPRGGTSHLTCDFFQLDIITFSSAFSWFRS